MAIWLRSRITIHSRPSNTCAEMNVCPADNIRYDLTGDELRYCAYHDRQEYTSAAKQEAFNQSQSCVARVISGWPAVAFLIPVAIITMIVFLRTSWYSDAGRPDG